MKNNLTSAIYKTLLYADLFNFPLTLEEIEKYLIWEEEEFPPNKLAIQETLERNKIKRTGKFYYLRDKRIIEKRKANLFYLKYL